MRRGKRTKHFLKANKETKSFGTAFARPVFFVCKNRRKSVIAAIRSQTALPRNFPCKRDSLLSCLFHCRFRRWRSYEKPDKKRWDANGCDVRRHRFLYSCRTFSSEDEMADAADATVPHISAPAEMISQQTLPLHATGLLSFPQNPKRNPRFHCQGVTTVPPNVFSKSTYI